MKDRMGAFYLSQFKALKAIKKKTKINTKKTRLTQRNKWT